MDDIKITNDLSGVYDKIKDIRVAMLSTLDRTEDKFHSRPMGTIKAEKDGYIWFFTYDTSEKANEIKHQAKVNLSYADPDNNTYVSISGDAEVVHDKAKAKELWSPILKAWFPDGLDSHGLALLKVKISEAEYWDSSANKMVRLFQMAKSILTGTIDDHGEHGKVLPNQQA